MMEQFKIGDWLQVIAGHERPIGSLFKVESCLTRYRATDVKLWQPKEGEWCWFWNTQKDLTLQKFWKMEQNYFIVAFYEKHKIDGIAFYDINDKHFKNCEPFIGELPSFLKEQ